MNTDGKGPKPLHKRETSLTKPQPGEKDPERVPELDGEVTHENAAGNPPTENLINDINDSSTSNSSK